MLYLLAHWLHYEGLTNLFRYQTSAPAPRC
jgi:phospho-N-acetylmuramoyl-pentapeptide-transferase